MILKNQEKDVYSENFGEDLLEAPYGPVDPKFFSVLCSGARLKKLEEEALRILDYVSSRDTYVYFVTGTSTRSTSGTGSENLMSQKVLCFLHIISALSFYIDILLTLSI